MLQATSIVKHTSTMVVSKLFQVLHVSVSCDLDEEQGLSV